MRYFRPRLGLTAWLLLLSATALLASGTARAQTAVTKYVVIQPIDVCLTTGWTSTIVGSCAPFNSLDNNPNPTKFTLTTPIGFVDPTTNVNDTRKIWLQAGIDVTFLPMAFYFNTNFLSIDDITCTTTSCTSTKFNNLTSGNVKPAPPLSPNSTTINMFFVDSLSGLSVGSQIYGFAWIGANGITVASKTFFPDVGQPVHIDTLAHELGHNYGLDHTNFGAGPSSTCPPLPCPSSKVCPSTGTACKSGQVCSVPFPGGCNVLDSGDYRIIPSSTGCSATATTLAGGSLFLLDGTAVCTTIPSTVTTVLDDQVILGNGSNVQQSVALSSLFMNPTPNVNAIAGGGDVSFTVTFPKFQQAGGRPGMYIAALVLALPPGFQFGVPLFTQTTPPPPSVFSFEQLNGNNGKGNSNCVKPISGDPSIECLEIDFVPDTFTFNTSISFTVPIIDKNTLLPATLSKLQCTSSDPLDCLDLTYVFSDLHAVTSAFKFRDKSGNLSANPLFPDETVASVIVNPADFPSVANLMPPLTFTGFNDTGCTSTSTSPSCPSGANGGTPTPLNSKGGD